MVTTSPRAMATGRATVWMAVRAASDGATAPTAARSGAAMAVPTRIRRRPDPVGQGEEDHA